MVILTEEQFREAEQSGLWSSKLEKDACGVGFVVSIKGVQTHKVRIFS